MKAHGDIFEHSGVGLTAMAMLFSGAWTKENGVNAAALPKYQFHHLVVNRIERRHVKQATSDAGLIRRDDHAVTVLVQAGNRVYRAVNWFPFAWRLDELVAIKIDYAVAIKNDEFWRVCHQPDST
jgi:hypothetical protein